MPYLAASRSALGAFQVVGDVTSLISTGANVLVPGSGPIVSVGASVLNALFGGNQDAVRQARETWFEQAARQGSPTAARIMVGGTQNTASHEIPMYQDGIKRLLADPRTAPNMTAALNNPYWDASDDASSSHMRALVESELQQLGTVVNPSQIPTSTPTSTPTLNVQGVYTPTTSGTSLRPWLLAAAVVVVAAVVVPHVSAPSHRRRRR
jgi:hypothetical protein